MAEEDRFASSDDLYTITVSGSMNPAIHHPRWYFATKLLNESEVAAAESSKLDDATEQPSTSALFCSSVFSQFSFGTFRVACLQNQWSVATTEKASLERARDLCSAVFELLPHTPVSGYGLSFAFHRTTPLSDVGKYLASLAEKLPLGLEPRADARPFSATFRYQLKRDDGEVLVVVEPSRRDTKKLFVSVSSSHRITEKGMFELRPKLENSFRRTSGDVENWLRAILGNFENLKQEAS